MNPGFAILSRLKRRYVKIRLAEIVLLTLAVVLIVWVALFMLGINQEKQIASLLAVGIAVFSLRFFQLGLHKTTEKTIASFINAHYAELGASADLALPVRHELTLLEKLQQVRTYQKLEALNARIHFPNHIQLFSILAIVGFAIAMVVYYKDVRITPGSSGNPLAEQRIQNNPVVELLPAEIAEAKISVTPPAYTGISQYPVTDLNLHIQENSRVTWSLKFSETIKNVSLVTSSQDTVQFVPDKDHWKLTRALDRNGFYQFIWQDQATHASDYYKIGIIKDQSPVIKLTTLNQFTQVTYDSKQSIEANPIITDDYGLTDAYIIATVSKGSGESVKFREEKIQFSTPREITGKQINARQLLDLKKLGMEPGDELYFYVEALDNKNPVANRTRTETYFITIPDTAQDVMATEGGLGVDLMPEYFRSQRQIIIDTEKLIRERKLIAKQEFKSRSNELGYDQKVLRLRYGQFLGEEEDSGVGPVQTHAHEDSDDTGKKPEDIIKEFGHQHDTENEHNLVEEKNPLKRGATGEKKEDPFAEFVHAHDNEETATFFFQSLKVKLKAALTQMWDAELYLRLYEPEKSLPYQYKALKLLKEISNDSRIYVHRTGFDPPPVNEEKRLSADLTEIFNATRDYEVKTTPHFPQIAKALVTAEKLLARQPLTFTQRDKDVLLQSGNELAQAALENPMLLEGLSALKELTSGTDSIKIETLKTLRKAYWAALPKQPAQAGKNNSTLHELDNQLIQKLQLLE